MFRCLKTKYKQKTPHVCDKHCYQGMDHSQAERLFQYHQPKKQPKDSNSYEPKKVLPAPKD